MANKNRLIVISGCSSGGKSTLLSELSSQGYTIVEEEGRKLVKQQLAANSGITPWEQPQLFCKLLIDKSIEAYHQAEKIRIAKNKIIFFDRSFLEGISYFQTLEIHDYDHIVNELRYYPTIFMTPPWEEIFSQDEERKNTFEDAINEYNRLMIVYPKYGYQISVIPKITVKDRIDFLLSSISDNNHDIN